jgi:hypothetical protein
MFANATDTTFNQRPETINRIGVNVAIYILSGIVVDYTMVTG